MAADFKTAQPVEYYRQFESFSQILQKEDVRPDGRELGEIRSTILNIGSIGTAEGSALVKLGNTTAVCGVKAELAVPTVENPEHGYIVPNVDLPPLCSPRFRPGPPSEQAQVVSQFIDDVIKNSKVISLEDLCVLKGKIVWVLYCDMMCLDYDGNVIDACVIALLAALRNVSLPSLKIDEETGAPTVTTSTKTSLQVKSEPVSTSFAVFDDEIIFADPTNEEECLATGVVTIVTDGHGRLCAVHKPGGSPLSDMQLKDCIKRALSRGEEVRKLLNETCITLDR
ncbi:exosome complex component RRP43-like [Ptychodera flava]|uniref:exosome complex component RRP43-like n=1 Tax=Ptychodera flava TaxID=63121 RepID=UPI003969E77E